MLLNNLIIADSGRKVNIRVSDGIIADVCLADNVGAAKNSPLDRVPPLALAVAQGDVYRHTEKYKSFPLLPC